MRQSVFSLGPLLLCSEFVAAGLYPTQPIANTVFRGGTWNDVTWKDSETQPALDQLGVMDIALFLGDTKYLANLATNVDPMRKRQSVFIPSELWTNATNFMMVFTPSTPPTKIYTAYFTIKDMTGNRSFRLGEKLRHSSANSSIPAPPVPSITPVGGNNDLVTVTMEMSDSSAAPFPEPTTAGTVGAMANSASNGGRHVRKPSVHFTFVFVLFPALFGLVLAI